VRRAALGHGEQLAMIERAAAAPTAQSFLESATKPPVVLTPRDRSECKREKDTREGSSCQTCVVAFSRCGQLPGLQREKDFTATRSLPQRHLHEPSGQASCRRKSQAKEFFV
jgi:hypothetical protein